MGQEKACDLTEAKHVGGAMRWMWRGAAVSDVEMWTWG